ncbi:MAG TPA: lysine decarboxylase, partial [Novosphingobium sp.]|nr:lysine decarboxylase [Novosphingobium sp.]
MTEEEISRRKFYKAEQEAGFVEKHETHTAQTQSSSYRLAFRDTEFLLREELRPVRFQLELLKT